MLENPSISPLLHTAKPAACAESWDAGIPVVVSRVLDHRGLDEPMLYVAGPQGIGNSLTAHAGLRESHLFLRIKRDAVSHAWCALRSAGREN